MKVLLLCHGKKHKYPTRKPKDDLCGTSGLTRETLGRVRLKTLDIDKKARPDIHHDIMTPLVIEEKFHIVSAMHAPYWIYVDSITCDLIDTTFINVRNMLKCGGYFVMTIADEGIYNFMKKYKLMPGRVQTKFLEDMESWERGMDHELYDHVREHVSDFIATCVCRRFPEFRSIGAMEKQRLLLKWNKSTRNLHDEHHLIVFRLRT